ncbi:uncharacterized protein LOC144508385 [Mustelus asterias]
MERVLFTALAVWLFLSTVESQPLTISVSESRVNAAAGDTVLLSVRPSVEVRSGTWKHDGNDVIVWIGTSVDINNNYTDRVKLVDNHSLLLKSVSVSDSGEYTVTMNSYSDTAASARINLLVFEPISSVYITSNVSNPMRENVSVCLTCHVVGNCSERIWFFNGSVVDGNEMIILSSENTTLTIIGVDATNVGDYQCIARNPASEKASGLYSLQIEDENSTPTQKDMFQWVIILAVLIPTLLICCATFITIRIHCCDQQCSCSCFNRYIFYYWLSCCNKGTLENIDDIKETGKLAGTWVACCSSRSKEESDSPCVEEPRTLSGLSMSCCSSVSRNMSELQEETKRKKSCGVLLSCCSGRSPDESERIRPCCCTWMSCCRTGLKGNVEASNHRGLWMSCCDCGLQKEHNEIRDLCDCWIACCNKGSEETTEIYTNPITSTTGQQQATNFIWTTGASVPAAGEPAQTEVIKEPPRTKSATAEALPMYAVVKKKNKTGTDPVKHGKNPPTTKPREPTCHYADLQTPDTGCSTRNVTSSQSEVGYATLKL